MKRDGGANRQFRWTPPAALHVLVDNDVPDAVANFFIERGYQVDMARELFPQGTPDPVIARRADQLGAIIATWNCRHFKSLLLRHKPDDQLRYPHASLIAFACQEVDGRQRIDDFIHLIEAEHAYISNRSIPRLIVEIGSTYFRLQR